MKNKKNTIILASLFLVICVLPLVIENKYLINVLIFTALNAAIATGLNIFSGYAGQISLGHAAFYGIGAYTSGILTVKLGIPPLPAILIAVLITTLFSYLIAIPTLKLKGHYLAMATLGFGIIVQIVLNEWTPVTSGACGLSGIPDFSFLGITVKGVTGNYYFAWFFFFAVILISSVIINSKTGIILRALKHNENFASSCGINVAHFKNITFVISAGVASVAGSIYAHYIHFISPESFGFSYSIFLVTVVVVGGMATLWGAFVGSVILTILPEVLRFAKDYDVVVYGLILILTILFSPEGVSKKIGLD